MQIIAYMQKHIEISPKDIYAPGCKPQESLSNGKKTNIAKK